MVKISDRTHTNLKSVWIQPMHVVSMTETDPNPEQRKFSVTMVDGSSYIVNGDCADRIIIASKE